MSPTFDMNALLDLLIPLGGPGDITLESKCLTYLRLDSHRSDILNKIKRYESDLGTGLPPFGRARTLLTATKIYSELLIGQVLQPAVDSGTTSKAGVSSLQGRRRELLLNIKRMCALAIRQDAMSSPPSICMADVLLHMPPNYADEMRKLHEFRVGEVEKEADTTDQAYCDAVCRLAVHLERELSFIFSFIDVIDRWDDNGSLTQEDAQILSSSFDQCNVSTRTTSDSIKRTLSTKKISTMEVARQLFAIVVSTSMVESPSSSIRPDVVRPNNSAPPRLSHVSERRDVRRSQLTPHVRHRPAHQSNKRKNRPSHRHESGADDGSCAMMMMPSSEATLKQTEVTAEDSSVSTGVASVHAECSVSSVSSSELNQDAVLEKETGMTVDLLSIPDPADNKSAEDDPNVDTVEGNNDDEEESLSSTEDDAGGALEQGAFSADYLLRYLSDDERETLRMALYSEGPLDFIVASINRDSVQRVSMRRLRPGKWINDEIVHAYLALLVDRDAILLEQNPRRKRCHFFKSYFISNLLTSSGSYNYKHVKRWGRRVLGNDIFDLDQIFVPSKFMFFPNLCLLFPLPLFQRLQCKSILSLIYLVVNIGGLHWALAVIDMTAKTITYYDSMNGDGRVYLNGLLRYLADEHRQKKRFFLSQEEWTLIQSNDTPLQDNTYDCGIFVCMLCDFLSLRRPLVFTQDHITRCRQRIAVSIIEGRVIE